MMKTAVSWDGPIAVRFPRGSGYGVPLDSQLNILPIGKAEVLKTGDDVVILALGSMVYPAVEAAQRLAQKGIAATVVNARFAKPLDAPLFLELAARIGRVVTVEEHALMGGFGSAVLETFTNAGLTNVKVKRLGIPDRFIEHAKPDVQLAWCGLTAEGIAEAAEALVGVEQPQPASKRA